MNSLEQTMDILKFRKTTENTSELIGHLSGPFPVRLLIYRKIRLISKHNPGEKKLGNIDHFGNTFIKLGTQINSETKTKPSTWKYYCQFGNEFLIAKALVSNSNVKFPSLNL